MSAVVDRTVYRSRSPEDPGLQRRREPVVWGDGRRGPLSPAEVAAFDERGLLTFEQVVPPHEAAALLEEARRLGDDPALADDERLVREPDGDELRSVFEVHRLHERFAALAAHPRIAGTARQVLGDDVYLHQTRVNLKPGFTGKEFWWHSDFETWHFEDGMPQMRAVTFAVALTDNLPVNGSLMVVPGSHRWFVGCVGETPEEHYKQSLRRQEYGVPSHAALEELVAEAGEIALATGPPGSAVVFDANAMHGSGGNITPYPRSAVFLVYNAVSNALVAPLGGTAPRPRHLACREPEPIRPGG